MATRKYVNIKDFEKRDFNILKQIGFSTVSGGVLTFNNNKIDINQLDNINENIKLLNSWIMINNSSNSNPEHRNKYQAYIWVKLIKRTEHVSTKTLIGIFKALNMINSNKQYKNRYSNLFIERINQTTLSEDWKDRFIRTIQ